MGSDCSRTTDYYKGTVIAETGIVESDHGFMRRFIARIQENYGLLQPHLSKQNLMFGDCKSIVFGHVYHACL